MLGIQRPERPRKSFRLPADHHANFSAGPLHRRIGLGRFEHIRPAEDEVHAQRRQRRKFPRRTSRDFSTPIPGIRRSGGKFRRPEKQKKQAKAFHPELLG